MALEIGEGHFCHFVSFTAGHRNTGFKSLVGMATLLVSLVKEVMTSLVNLKVYQYTARLNIIVAYKGNKRIKIFSYREEYLSKFGGASTHDCQSLSLYSTRSIYYAVETLYNGHLGDKKEWPL